MDTTNERNKKKLFKGLAGVDKNYASFNQIDRYIKKKSSLFSIPSQTSLLLKIPPTI